MYNLMSLAEFAARPWLQWPSSSAGGDIRRGRRWASWSSCSRHSSPTLSALLTEDRLPAWRAWARWRVINSRSPYLSNAFVEENFRFYGTVLIGYPGASRAVEARRRPGRGLAR